MHTPHPTLPIRLIGCLTAFLPMLTIGVAAAEPFTIVALPDTQNYTSTNYRNNTYFKGQTRWIANNMASRNMAFVMHLGDIQNLGNPYYANGDPTPWLNGDESQWIRADASLDILDNNNVPYSLVPGNHDYLRASEKKEPIYYLKWFGPHRFEDKPTYGGASPATPTSMAGMNTYHLFDGGEYKFLNIALQYRPDRHDLTWAQKVINENPGLPTIVTTHAYISRTGYQHKYIFDDFVKLNPQIVMTLNGHLTGEHLNTGTNIAGLPVHQMLVDYQATEFDGYFKGGGYLRTMTFDTDRNRVDVKSYSPVIGNYLTDSDSQFSLPLNLRQRFGLAGGEGITRTARFRQGVDGYTGTRDTYLVENEPGATHNEAILWIDGDNNNSAAGSPDAQGLIRFGQIFGENDIPDGATIESATLTLHTSELPNSQSLNTISLHRLLKPWGEGATWDSQGNGIAADAADAIYAANDTVVPSLRDAMVSFDVTESLFAWVSGAHNYGWALLPGGGNGWRVDSSEAGDLFDRPMLEVTFRTVPEPGMAAVLGGIGLLSLRRRGRGRDV